MKLKIPFGRKKIRVPRIKKQARIPLVIGTLIILIALGMYFHLLPGIGSLAHLFEPRVTADPLQSLGGAATPLSTDLAKPLIADFLASPGYQSDPLSVQFFDMSRGEPGTWLWNFGDNATSDLQNPVHRFSQPGMYDVTLTVARGDGAWKTMTEFDVLDTRQAAESQLLVDTIRTGSIKKGSFLSFVSTDNNSSVTVNGKQVPLPAGSLVKIRANTDTTGTLSLRSSNILGCSLADATLFMNGTQGARGSFSDCFVPSVQSLSCKPHFYYRAYLWGGPGDPCERQQSPCRPAELLHRRL